MVGHHAPDEAGEFTSDSGSGDIVWTREVDSLEFAFKAFVGFVGGSFPSCLAFSAMDFLPI